MNRVAQDTGKEIPRFLMPGFDKLPHVQRRERILAKTKGHCWYCGCDLRSKKWVIEHQQRRAFRFVRCKSDNLVPACYPCNNKKRNMSIEELRAHLRIDKFYGEKARGG